MTLGHPDIPIETTKDNDFKTNDYVQVLKDFILECDTPMTIAIQGDWGTGKTSMMKMIQNEINPDPKKENTPCVWLNTWQFSQFNLGNQLPIVLITKLIKDLSNPGKAKEIMDRCGRLFKAGLAFSINMASHGNAGAKAEDFSLNIDDIETLEGLKKDFETIISDKAGKDENARVIVFVDDLDRLPPEKAVEVLEVLKLFVDCKKCVFVLAVDYDVVVRGVRAKYGDDLSDEKGKSFFDKIIQMPFKMPVGMYDINGYLKKLMHTIWGEIEDDELDDINDYLEIIELSIGKNPRSIKRTVNSFTVINKVAAIEGKFDKDDLLKRKNQQKVLFILLCLQLSYENLYNYLLGQVDDIRDNGLANINKVLENEEELNKLMLILKKKNQGDLTDETIIVKELLERFVDWGEDLIGKGKNKDAESLLSILSLSSITANDSKINRSVERRRDRSTIHFIGHDWPKSQLPREVINAFVKKNGNLSVEEIREEFKWPKQTNIILEATDAVMHPSGKKRQVSKNTITIQGKEYAVWSDWGTGNDFQGYYKEVLSQHM